HQRLTVNVRLNFINIIQKQHAVALQRKVVRKVEKSVLKKVISLKWFVYLQLFLFPEIPFPDGCRLLSKTRRDHIIEGQFPVLCAVEVSEPGIVIAMCTTRKGIGIDR